MHPTRQRAHHALRVPRRHPHEHYEARVPLDERGDARGVAAADQHVAFPVAGTARSAASAGRSRMDTASEIYPA